MQWRDTQSTEQLCLIATSVWSYKLTNSVGTLEGCSMGRLVTQGREPGDGTRCPVGGQEAGRSEPAWGRGGLALKPLLLAVRVHVASCVWEQNSISPGEG